LFSRQDAKKLLDRVAEENPKLVEDLVPKLLPLAVLQRVLQNLLRERVSIRDAVTILEALGDAANITRNPILFNRICAAGAGTHDRTAVSRTEGRSARLLPRFLHRAGGGIVVEHGEHTSQINLAPQKIREILERFVKRLQNVDVPSWSSPPPARVTSCGSWLSLFQERERALA